MASSQNNPTKFNFGEEGINDNNDENDSDDEEYNAPLLETKLSCPTPRDYREYTPSYSNKNSPIKPGHSRNTQKSNSNSLSFSHSHSYSYSHFDFQSPPSTNINLNLNNNNNIYPTPQYSVDSLSSPCDLSKLKEWLTMHSLPHIYNKLIKAGYDSIDIFAECDGDDIKQIANDHNLSTPQRLKLRKAIRSLKNGNQNNNSLSSIDPMYRITKQRSDSVIITEQQKTKMMQMSTYLDNMDECVKIIQQKADLLEEEKKCKEDEICKEFSLMFNILHQRRTHLMKELHFIYQQKKDIFEQTLTDFAQIIENAKVSQKQCSKLILSQSIINYEDNIRVINEIESQITNMVNSCLHSIGPININTKINVQLKTKDIIQIFAVMGDVNEDNACHEELTYDPLNNNKNNNKKTAYVSDDDEDEDEELKQIQYDREQPPTLQRHPLYRDKRVRSGSVRSDHRSSHKHRNRERNRNRNRSRKKYSDKWSECGDNLLIAPEIHSASNKITNIGKIRNNNHCYKGSGFAEKVIFSDTGIHFWKVRVLCNNIDHGPFNTFAIGFVSSFYGSNRRNSWFLTHDKSMGIYCDKQIWCSGKKISNNNGIVMQNKDIINIALDLHNKCVYIQRCKYNKHKNDYTVYPNKIIKNLFDINNGNKYGYRLACYLRQKGQSITILQYSNNKPFPEWC